MLSSVEFDDQFYCRCIKISDGVADGFLPIELHAKNLFSPQVVPRCSSASVGFVRRERGFKSAVVG